MPSVQQTSTPMAVTSRDHFQHAVELLVIAHFAPSRPHANPAHARLLRPAGDGQDFFLLHQRRGFHFGLIARGLRAIAAVFRASAGLDGDQLADLNFGRIVITADGAARLETPVPSAAFETGANFSQRPIVANGGFFYH